MKKFLLVMLLVLFSFSCVTKISVSSNIEGADVIIDGEKVGETPYVGNISAYAWYDPVVVLKKDGYKTQKTSFVLEPRVGHIVAGWLFFSVPVIGWPLLLTCYGPTKKQFVEMEKE